MAKKKSGVNKSEEIRQIYRANHKMKAKDVVAALAEKGISVTEGLVYLVKGKLLGRRRRRRRAQRAVANVAQTTGSADALATVLKIKNLADQVGGMKRLKALIEAISE